MVLILPLVWSGSSLVADRLFLMVSVIAGSNGHMIDLSHGIQDEFTVKELHM